MATKKELVSSILEIKEVDTQSNLMAKSNKELLSILSELESSIKESNEESTDTKESVKESIDVKETQSDMEEMMKKMKEEMMKEMEEKIRKELEDEMKSSNETSLESLPKPRKKVEIDRFEQIPVMNVTNHTLVYISKKTGAEWLFSGFGDIEYIEFQELLTMRSGQKKFLDEPYLIILDDDAVNYLGLTKMYEDLIDVEKIEDVLKMNQEYFENIIDKSPKGIRHTIISKIKERVENGEDISIKKVRYVNERFNLDIGQRG